VGAFFVEKTEREYVNLLLKQDKFIDVVVPRGGYGLSRAVAENSSIPVIKHDAGICHIYLAPDASPDMVEKIILNAKTQRPGVCNALETLLIDEKYPHKKEIFDSLKAHNVLLKGCPKSREIMPQMETASDKEYGTEWLDLILSVKIVKDMTEAMGHIAKYSSGHSEGIISNDYNLIGEFLNKVDSAALFVNCSTRFHDGGQFGLGAEVGISTQKLHVRGPMGLEHLTCKKYIVLGQGQIRE
jgi:glutamate-5-semialdehyde dehydrogenase